MGNKPPMSINRDANIFIARQPDYFGVSKSDWNRLKKTIDSCKYKTNWWANLCSTFIGISASSLISYLTIPLSTEDEWIKPVILCVAILTAIMSLICYFANRREKSLNTSDIQSIKDIISEIDNSLTETEQE